MDKRLTERDDVGDCDSAPAEQHGRTAARRHVRRRRALLDLEQPRNIGSVTTVVRLGPSERRREMSGVAELRNLESSLHRQRECTAGEDCAKMNISGGLLNRRVYEPRSVGQLLTCSSRNSHPLAPVTNSSQDIVASWSSARQRSMLCHRGGQHESAERRLSE